MPSSSGGSAWRSECRSCGGYQRTREEWEAHESPGECCGRFFIHVGPLGFACGSAANFT